MGDYVTLTCPSCGGKLKIANNVQRFACAYCGNEHIVKRDEGIVTIEPVIEELHNIHIGVDKTSSELAIKRLQEELNSFEKEFSSLLTAHFSLPSRNNPRTTRGQPQNNPAN